MASTQSTERARLNLGHGPGSRGNGCDICLEEMRDNDATITHVACQNTFHKSCFDSWAESTNRWANLSSSQYTTTTCPKCRATVNIRSMSQLTSPLEDSRRRFRESLESLADRALQRARELAPQHPRTALNLTTAECEMYDYAMTDTRESTMVRVTVAWQHHFCAQNDRARTWLVEYFVRLREAQMLPPENLARSLTSIYIATVEKPSRVYIRAVDSELREGERATDLEIIDEEGNRRPRKWVVDSYIRDPTEFIVTLQRRTRSIRELLALDLWHMHEVQNNLISRVQREVRRRSLSNAPRPSPRQLPVRSEWP